MLDFTPVHTKQMTLNELAKDLQKTDLYNLTTEMVETQHRMIESCTDADVVFVPDDPFADDPFAENPDDVTLAWTLGHLIVHVTASSEEAAAIAAELARGVKYHGRSRHEIPWQSVRTIKQCRDRLSESLRLRLASLEMWPDQPHLDNQYQSRPGAESMNAVSRFLYGLMHDDDHLEHLHKIIDQSQQARRKISP
ncbi:MAG: DinB family protein [Chloroflexota bacterium]|nr:MAG: DinB family protein [Chloroflexota bacterium]